MEILDYRVEGYDNLAAKDSIPSEYLPYVGKYTNLFMSKVFNFYYLENSFVVDIPNQAVLSLNDPDDKGCWYPAMTRQIYFKFTKNNEGQVEEMILAQPIVIPRLSKQDTIPHGTPEPLTPYIGTYSLPQARLNLDVSCEEGHLSVPDILGRTPEKLILYKQDEIWRDNENNYEITFIKDENGDVTGMNATIFFYCPKGEPAATAIEPIINASGITEGLKKYNEMKSDPIGKYIFTEGLMNDLGYRLLTTDKATEAIEVFKVNVQDYPNSFNVYDSLGEAYMKHGDKELAIINYEKSVQLNPENENGKTMLEKMKSGN
jgi:hypothetical protein